MMQFVEIYRAGCDGRLSKSEGAGSRGGNVIGKTKSGKAIYGDKRGVHLAYAGFSAQDHRDAATAHQQAYDAENTRAKDTYLLPKEIRASAKKRKNHVLRGGEHRAQALKAK